MNAASASLNIAQVIRLALPMAEFGDWESIPPTLSKVGVLVKILIAFLKHCSTGPLAASHS